MAWWDGPRKSIRSRGSGPRCFLTRHTASQGDTAVQYLRDRGFGRRGALHHREAGQDAASRGCRVAARVGTGGARCQARATFCAGLDRRVRRQAGCRRPFAPHRGLDRGDPGRAAGRSHRPRQHGHRGPRADGARREQVSAWSGPEATTRARSRDGPSAKRCEPAQDALAEQCRRRQAARLRG